jgi:hypothetical protein
MHDYLGVRCGCSGGLAVRQWRWPHEMREEKKYLVESTVVPSRLGLWGGGVGGGGGGGLFGGGGGPPPPPPPPMLRGCVSRPNVLLRTCVDQQPWCLITCLDGPRPRLTDFHVHHCDCHRPSRPSLHQATKLNEALRSYCALDLVLSFRQTDTSLAHPDPCLAHPDPCLAHPYRFLAHPDPNPSTGRANLRLNGNTCCCTTKLFLVVTPAPTL